MRWEDPPWRLPAPLPGHKLLTTSRQKADHHQPLSSDFGVCAVWPAASCSCFQDSPARVLCNHSKLWVKNQLSFFKLLLSGHFTRETRIVTSTTSKWGYVWLLTKAGTQTRAVWPTAITHIDIWKTLEPSSSKKCVRAFKSTFLR